jgi:DNA-binding NtrC family response regulator
MTMKPISNEQLKCFIEGGGNWEDLQKALIVAGLDLFDGNKTYVAQAIGVSVRTIRNKIKFFELRATDVKAKGK